MRITDHRCGWTVEGRKVGEIRAAVRPTDDELATYFGVVMGDRQFKEFARPTKHPRVVLLKPDGAFCIVPINPDHYVITED